MFYSFLDVAFLILHSLIIIFKNCYPKFFMRYFDVWTGIAITDATAEQLAWSCLAPALVTSVGLNLRDFITKKKGEDDSS